MKTALCVEVGAEIERSAAEVWSMVSDLTRLPEWLGEFVQVVQETDGPVGEGTVFRYTLAPGPGERSGALQIVAWEPGHRLA